MQDVYKRQEEITHIFKTAVRNSVAYMTMTRLGIDAGEYSDPDDLRDVVTFTTPATPVSYTHLPLVESVKERGVITPATVRQKEDGRYELISGHRRKRACELAGFEALRCEVVDLDRDAATVLMVESVPRHHDSRSILHACGAVLF